jgi:hypothetical protein
VIHPLQDQDPRITMNDQPNMLGQVLTLVAVGVVASGGYYYYRHSPTMNVQTTTLDCDTPMEAHFILRLSSDGLAQNLTFREAPQGTVESTVNEYVIRFPIFAARQKWTILARDE